MSAIKKKKPKAAYKKNSPIPVNSKYDHKFCAMLVEHMSEGFTFESFAGLVGCDDSTLDNWVKAYPEFSEAKNVARSSQLLANEKMIKDIAKSNKGNATAAIFILKNCHPAKWRDRKEIELSPPKNMETAEIIKELKETLDKLESK